MDEQQAPAPEWARSWLRSEHVAGSVRVDIVHATRSGERRSAPELLGIGESLVVGRPDRRLSGTGGFRPWPGDSTDRTLPRQAVRIDLLLDHLRFTLSDSFRGTELRSPAIEADLNGRRLGREDFRMPALDLPASKVGERAVLAIHRATGSGERETVRFEVEVQYSLRAGTRTIPAPAQQARAAAEIVRVRWWRSVQDLRVGATFRAATALVAADDRHAVAAALLERLGRPEELRIDRVIAPAARSLFETVRGGTPVEWDGHLRALDVAHLYTVDAVEPATDGAREYRRFGDLDAFLALTVRLVHAGVLPATERR